MRLNSLRTRRRASGFMFWTVSSKTYAETQVKKAECVVVREGDFDGQGEAQRQQQADAYLDAGRADDVRCNLLRTVA